MPSPSIQCKDVLSENLNVKLLDELSSVVVRVKKARKWSQVNPLTKSFIRACLIMRLQTVKSSLLMKAIIKTIKELRRLISKDYLLIEIGIREVWKLSELASSWGHKSAGEWRYNKSYTILQALTLQWVTRLLGSITKL